MIPTLAGALTYETRHGRLGARRTWYWFHGVIPAGDKGRLVAVATSFRVPDGKKVGWKNWGRNAGGRLGQAIR